MIGASDGKFVLPLAEAGHNVIAIEKDPLALYGGEVLLPVSGFADTPGLVERLKEAELQDRVRIVAEDFLDSDPADVVADAVWTSCSWHYSANHRRPLVEFIARMQQLVHPGGVFGAEFMMPVEERHDQIEHYTTPDTLASYFGDAWDVLLPCRPTRFLNVPTWGDCTTTRTGWACSLPGGIRTTIRKADPATMKHEYEAKFLSVDVEAVRTTLIALGAIQSFP